MTALSPGRCTPRAAAPRRRRIAWRCNHPATKRRRLGQRHRGVARQAFVPRQADAGRDAAYRSTVQARAPGATWGRLPLRALHHRAAHRRLGGRHVADPGAGPGEPDRVTYLRSEATPPAGTLVRAHRPTCRRPKRTGSTWTVHRSTPGRASPTRRAVTSPRRKNDPDVGLRRRVRHDRRTSTGTGRARAGRRRRLTRCSTS